MATTQKTQDVHQAVKHDDRPFVDDDPKHDAHGHAKDPASRFDARHTEDVFPY